MNGEKKKYAKPVPRIDEESKGFWEACQMFAHVWAYPALGSFASSPANPPTAFNPKIAKGRNPNTMRKNWSTSL